MAKSERSVGESSAFACGLSEKLHDGVGVVLEGRAACEGRHATLSEVEQQLCHRLAVQLVICLCLDGELQHTAQERPCRVARCAACMQADIGESAARSRVTFIGLLVSAKGCDCVGKDGVDHRRRLLVALLVGCSAPVLALALLGCHKELECKPLELIVLLQLDPRHVQCRRRIEGRAGAE